MQHELHTFSLKSVYLKIYLNITHPKTEFKAKCRLCPIELHFWPICNASIWALQYAKHFGKYYLVSEWYTYTHSTLVTTADALKIQPSKPKLEKRHLALQCQHYMSIQDWAKHHGLWQRAYFSSENIKTETHFKIKSQKLSSEIQVLKSNCTPKAQGVQEIFILFFMPIGKQDTPELCTKAFSSTTTKDTQPRGKVQICLNFLESPWNVGSDSRDFTWSSLPHPQGSDLYLLLVLTLCPLAEFIYRAYN